VNLKDASTHFQFGSNWESYVKIVNDKRVFQAIKGLEKLISRSDIEGKRFFDIGCGSGLSMLAALHLGASEVSGVDIDHKSICAAHALLSQWTPGKRWSVYQRSVFELNPIEVGDFDVVHSWGVLHHTGNMWEAIAKAASLVRKNGLLVIAVYHKTAFCNLWRVEKKLYSQSNASVQRIIRLVYKAAFLTRKITLGENALRFISQYHGSRGMDWHHDVHDWLGGYPYESVSPEGVVGYLEAIGFTVEMVFENHGGGKGVFGTGCDEFVARNSGAPRSSRARP